MKTKNEKNQINFCKATFCRRFLDARREKTELSQPTRRAQSFARREKPLTFIGSDTRQIVPSLFGRSLVYRIGRRERHSRNVPGQREPCGENVGL